MARKATKPTKTRTKRTREAAPAQPAKPVFRLGTWITLIVFAAVLGAAIYLNYNPIQTDEEAEAASTSEPAFLFDSTSLVTSIEVKPAEGETVRLERDEENAWVLTQPDESEADQGLAEAAASQVGALLITSEIEGEPEVFGLGQPAFVITVEFEDGTSGVLEVGSVTPTNSGYYVRMDDKMYIVSLDGIEALTNLVSSPPYLATATPEATEEPTSTSTPTLIPTAEATATPEATPTP